MSFDGLDLTLKMLCDAFPEHCLTDKQYWHIIVLLYSEMSDRQLAKILSKFTDKEISIIYNDIAKISSLDYTNDKEFNETKEKLIRCGYFQWLNDND